MSLRRRLLLAGIVVVVVLFVADVALAVTFRTFLLGRLLALHHPIHGTMPSDHHAVLTDLSTP